MFYFQCLRVFYYVLYFNVFISLKIIIFSSCLQIAKFIRPTKVNISWSFTLQLVYLICCFPSEDTLIVQEAFIPANH